jgi:hypothetical protein
MKILALLLLLALVPDVSRADAALNSKLYDQLSDVLKAYSKLKPGTSRAEFLKVFAEDGGLSVSRGPHRFIYQQCPNIKVDVEFNLKTPDQKGELPTDTIRSISKPYLEPPFFD